MIHITIEPTQLVIDQICPVSITLTNSENKLCTHINLKLRLPPQIVLLEGNDKIDIAKINPFQTVTYTLRVRPKQIGSWLMGSSSFSYRDGQGQSQHPAPLQQEVKVVQVPSVSELQSVNVLGNNNQIIAVDGSIIQNNKGLIPDGMISEAKLAVPPANTQGPVKNDNENKVFVSYAWGGESERIVEELQQALANHGIEIIRDKNHLACKGSIDEFEQRIGRGKCVILVISDKYLRSEHCMYEFVQIWEHHDLPERIFPIILEDAYIFYSKDRVEYIKYWDQKIEELNRAIKGVKIMTSMIDILEDLDKYEQVRRNFSHLTDLVRDMNLLTSEIHASDGYSTLISAIERSMGR